MGVQGVPHGFTDQELFDALEATNGVVVKAAEVLRLSPRNLHALIRQKPHLKNALAEIRRQFQYSLLDQSENVLRNVVFQEEDLALALKGATYILNNLGAERGYGLSTQLQPQEEKCIADKLLSPHAEMKLDEEGKNIVITESLSNVLQDFIVAAQQHQRS